MKTLRSALLAGVLLIVLVSSLFPASVRAQEPPPPENPPEEEPAEGERSGILTHIFKLIFPVETMQAATETLLVNILQRNAEGVEAFFSRIAIGMTLLNPGVKTPACNGLGVWRDIEGEGVFVPTWNFSVKIAVALWPATLAIMAAMAAGQSAISTSWGVTNLKGAMAEWLTGVLLCAFSLEILDLINRLSNAIIVGIIEMPIGVSVNLQKIVGWILSAPLKGSSSVPVVAALIAILAELVLGIALVISLFGQLFARGALLYVIVAITPLVLVISILPPARWLRWLWVKGILLVMLLGPITALLLKLLAALHRVLTDRHILGFVMIVGVLSVLLAINGAIIKGVFGAAGEVLGKAQQTATGIVRGVATAGAAAAAVVLSGGAALGALPGIAAASGGAAVAGVGASAGAAAQGPRWRVWPQEARRVQPGVQPEGEGARPEAQMGVQLEVQEAQPQIRRQRVLGQTRAGQRRLSEAASVAHHREKLLPREVVHPLPARRLPGTTLAATGTSCGSGGTRQPPTNELKP
jgi:hypothetical protein